MRIKSSQITSKTDVQLTGQETWLESIYEDFARQESVDGAKQISGQLSLTKGEDGSVCVTGHLDYTPAVSCARCDKGIPWPLSVDVNATVLPNDHTPLPRDHNLSEEELDSYVMEGDEVDLEMLVNDAIQTALPSQFLAASEDGKSCKICHIDISSTKVFSAGDTENASPFAALRGMKLPKGSN